MYDQREYFNLIDPDSELQVLYAGEQQCRPGHSHTGRRHHALWHVVLKGRGRVFTPTATWEVEAGDSFLFLPDQTMGYQADGADPWRYLWLGLGGRRVAHHLARCGFSPEAVVNRGGAYSAAIGDHAQALLVLLKDAREGRQADSLRLQSRLYSLLELLSRANEAPPKTVTVPYVRELVALMETAYSRSLTAASLARYAGLERTYCARLFQRETGVGMKAYLTRIRMAKAQALLRETAMTVKAVAESVGYPNEEAFSKRFKRTCGVTPSGYREGRDRQEPSAQ